MSSEKSGAPLARLSTVAPSLNNSLTSIPENYELKPVKPLTTVEEPEGEEDDDDEDKPQIPDGGWGWMIVFASSLLCVIQDGISFSFGMLFPEFVREFNASNTETSWIGSLFVSVPLLTGPIMSALVDKYGCRSMTILAGLVSASGFVLSYFVRDVRLMYLTFGIISGLGLGLTFVTAVVSIAFWFEKKRNLAVGLGACGVGIGTFVYAPFTSYLLGEFGWRWTVMLLGGTLLNMCVCGALMRDPEWLIQQNKKKMITKQLKKRAPEERLNIDQLKTLLASEENPSSEATKSKNHQSEQNLPTYIKQNESKSPVDDGKLKRRSSAPRLVKQTSNPNPNPEPNNGVVRFSRRSLSHHDLVIQTKNKKKKWYKKRVKSLKEMFDFALFLDFHFFLMSLSTIILFAWFMTPYFYLPDHMELWGYTKGQAAITMAVMGVTNTIGMVILGWAGDQKWCSVPKTYAACLVLCGIFCSLQIFCSSSYIMVTIASGFYGFFLASSYSFTPIIVTLLLPLDVFTKAYGLMLLCQGIGHLLGPPVAAFLYDQTSSWDASFHLSAFWIVVSGLLIIVIPYTKNRTMFRKNIDDGGVNENVINGHKV